MFRLVFVVCLWATVSVHAQFVIRMPGPVGGFQPLGGIPQPMRPMVGITSPPRLNALPAPRYLTINPFGIYSGFVPVFPMWVEPPNPRQIINNNYYIAPPLTSPAPAPMPKMIETKAKLLLFVPPDAVVNVNGQKQSTNSRPIVVESPSLRDGQTYRFEVQVTWPDDGKTIERRREIVVERGDEKSVIYNK